MLSCLLLLMCYVKNEAASAGYPPCSPVALYLRAVTLYDNLV